MDDLFAPGALSVSELNSIADELLGQQFLGVWVAGEVSNLTRAASGHYYFSLKDDLAQVRCTLFKFAAARLAQPLREGEHIEVCGKIGIYAARGEFQINVNEVRQVGVGQLFERYERLKKKLDAEGLFAPERKQRLPENPQRIGVVTSLAAAALRDVVSTLRRRAPHLALVVYPTPVQGAGSEQQIAQAIRAADERAEVDVLIVCRGGGSLEDLWAFNEEAVARAIADCALPVVSGVGHETDFTLVDFVADVRAPTPTGAAELVSPNRAELLHKLANYQARFQAALQQRYQNAAQQMDFLAKQLQHPRQKWQTQRAQVAQWHAQLTWAMGQQLGGQRHRLTQAAQALRGQQPDVARLQQRVERFQAALSFGWQTRFQAASARLAKQADVLAAMSPHAVLERGFAIVHNARGQVVRDADSLKQGQTLHVSFAHGASDVQVLSLQKQGDLFD